MSQPVKIALILALAALPLLEIGLLIRLGQLLGIWWLAAIIIGTAILGTYVIRRVGLRVFERALSRLGSDREGFSPLFDSNARCLVSGQTARASPRFLTAFSKSSPACFSFFPVSLLTPSASSC